MSDLRYFGNYNTENGDYEGFYTSDIWTDFDKIPKPNIELTKDEWIEARGNSRYRVINGKHTHSPYTTNEVNKQELNNIRLKRNALLSETDWVVLPHSPITGSKLDEWILYRDKLRNITEQTPPYTLPTKPE